MKSKRILYFDLLKVVSAIAVVFIHVISRFWYDLNPDSYNFSVLTIFDGCIRFAVPIYFMISGALFLDENKQINIKLIFRKYILKIFILYFIWNIAYSIGTSLFINNEIITLNNFVSIFLRTILGEGIYHLTFLVTIIGFYLCVPILRCITKKENKKLLEYFIIMIFLFTSLLPTLLNYYNIKLGYEILFSGIIIYPILGYYLHNFDLQNKKAIYMMGIIGTIFTIVVTIIYSRSLGIPNEYFFGYLTPNVIFSSSLIFLIFKNIKIENKKVITIINYISKNYFGIYLIHGLIIGFLMKLNFFSLNFSLHILVILGTMISFFISFLIVDILRRIPVIKYFITIS